MVSELMYRDIWANGPAVAVISALMGPSPRVTYVNGNTSLGAFNGVRQGVHADVTFNHAQLPFGVVTNYYLVDASPANGSTELWVGSHRDTTWADHKNYGSAEFKEGEIGIRDECLEARRQWAPPIQPTVERGSVILRDLRLWHAGLPNPSSSHRVMLAFVHTPWWYRCADVVTLPERARVLVEGWSKGEHPVAYNASYIPDVDHKQVKFSVDFSSGNAAYNAMLPPVPKREVNGVGSS
jgi:ectoine hydroxylase-related dioxygenase (phytanoyl-CoA dioxygenase family)